MTGSPKGPQYVLISNKLCQMIIIPRSDIAIVNEREELKNPSFYLLLGEDINSKPKAYIGQTEVFADRIKHHDNKKKFWNKALIFVSIGGAMTKADVEYLEYRGVQRAKEENRFDLENTQIPKQPNLPEHQRDAMDEFFEDCVFMTSFIGCSIFEKEEINNKDIYNIDRLNCNAKGVYNEEGFKVLKDSRIIRECSRKYKYKANREKWVKAYTYEKDGELYLNSDYQFSSPSTAASYCLGRSSNGWTEWKDKDKNTLDQNIRKAEN